MKLWSSVSGDVNVPAIQPNGKIEISADAFEGLSNPVIALLEADDLAAMQQAIAPGSTILSAAATAAIAALDGAATAADIVDALQATDE